MISVLWRWYRDSPAGVRRAIAAVTPLAGRAIGLFKTSIQINAFELCLDFADNAAFRYLRYGASYERELVEKFLTAISLNSRAIVLDIGASYGFFSLTAASIGKYGLVKKIFSYEPDQRSHAALQSSIRRNNVSALIKLQRCIVGDRDGTANVFLSKLSSSSNKSFQTDETFAYAAVETIPCVQIDTNMAETTSIFPRKSSSSRLMWKVANSGFFPE